MEDSVYHIVEMVGTSEVSWEQAAENAVRMAKQRFKDLRVAEISKLDMTLEDGKVVCYRARVQLSYKMGQI